MRRVTATRYVTPLREGGSLPALLEADDLGLYVCKLRGAGQGPKALVAELVAGGLAEALGLPVPERVLVELDPRLGAAEPDPEIQELLQASAGLNVGLDYLPGALALDGPAIDAMDPELAATTIWLDALVLNVDRTPRNPNLLSWHGAPWLIDHGAALYPQHAAGPLVDRAGQPFAGVLDHVLFDVAAPLASVDAAAAARLSEEAVRAVVETVPPAWTGERDRDEYAEFLLRRLDAPRSWVAAADAARRAHA